ncbi:MAG: M6 family metalloprotease domain-containing protein, partial [Chitinophagaceae bacterium]
PLGIVRHLQESASVIRAKIEKREFLLHSHEIQPFEKFVRVFGPNKGLLEGRQLSAGKIKGLTILVNFSDVKSSTTKADVEEMLNAKNYTKNGNICSVREYFLKMSSGKLDYTNVVIGPITLSRPRHHYIEKLLVEETMDLVSASGINLKQFDSRNEGIIDAINILYAGQSQYQGNLWPHNSNIDLKFGNVRTDLYLLTGLGRNSSELSIGTFCHENGHLLCRFPDMYDYGKRDDDSGPSAGIGFYCLMGAGNHLDSGRSPAPVCAYLRDLAGWCDNSIDLNKTGDYEAVHEDYNTILKYSTNNSNEYFLVESRLKKGFDRACTSNGLAIYHCDITGSNEWQQGTPSRHYQCALLQADGNLHLERNENQGDGSDLFRNIQGTVISSKSSPHSRQWDGRDSGLILSNFKLTSDRIKFKVGNKISPKALPDTTNGSDEPEYKESKGHNLLIKASGIIQKVNIAVTLTQKPDDTLTIELMSPAKRRVLFFSNTYQFDDDNTTLFDSEKPGQLDRLVGLPMKGKWTVRIFDKDDNELDILKKWSVEIDNCFINMPLAEVKG